MNIENCLFFSFSTFPQDAKTKTTTTHIILPHSLEMTQQSQYSSRSTSFYEDLELSNNFPGLQTPTNTNDLTTTFLKKQPLLFSNSDNLPLLETKPKVLFKNFLTISSCSLLISFSYFCNLILLIMNLHFIGRMNEPILINSIGLGNVWVNCLGINLVVGYNYGF